MEGWRDRWRRCGRGCAGLWCGVLCAGVELVTIENKKKLGHVFVTHLCLKDCVSSDACWQCFGSSFDKYM